MAQWIGDCTQLLTFPIQCVLKCNRVHQQWVSGAYHSVASLIHVCHLPPSWPERRGEGGKERDEGREGKREGEGRGGRQGGRVIVTCYMATVVCKYGGSIYLYAVAMRV